jgi:hypothetical protein
LTLKDIERAELAIFAARAAGQGATVDQMKAIACCIRNRVRQGWHDSSWLKVMEHAWEYEGNLPTSPVRIDPENSSFLRWLRDADEVYFGYTSENSIGHMARQREKLGGAQAIKPQASGIEEALQRAVYWAFIDRPFTVWFQHNVLHGPDAHRDVGNLGTLFFYE